MKISEVTVQRFFYPTPIVIDSNGHIHPGEIHNEITSMLKIVTDDGHEGHAFGGSKEVIEKIVKPELLGEDPLKRESIWKKLKEKQRIMRRFLNRDLHVVDLALWDIAGQIFQVPVYKILGGSRNRVKAYASTMCGDDLEGGLRTPNDYADFAISCRDRGYSAYKMHLWVSPHPGAPDWKKDIEACRVVKEAVGDSMRLMVDCSGGYNRQEAYLYGRELEKLGFYWIEEPVDEAEVNSYVWLTKHFGISVVGPETPADIATRAEWIIRGASDINRCGAQDVGGITPLVKVVHMLETFGVPFDIHMSDPGNLQVLGMTSMGEYYERGLLHPLYDYDQPPPYLHQIYDPMDDKGYVHISELPGIGLDINFEYINANLINEEMPISPYPPR